MNRRDTERLLAAIRGVRSRNERAALATIVRVTGSAYRREGTRILVREDGSYECVLSGGCLEPAVAAAAARVILTGTPALSHYDLADDSVWSLGVGCSGAVDIYIERLDGDPVESSWLQALEGGEAAVLVRSLSGASGRLLVLQDIAIGSLGDVALDREASDRARARLRAPFPHSWAETNGPDELFFDVNAPAPHLAIFGAGADSEPLASHAWELGFDVTVIDVRESFLTARRFPHASLVASHYSHFDESVRLSGCSYVVIMNHHLERDRESLRFALGSDAPYIGVLGPRSRFRKLLTTLGTEVDRAGLPRVRSPVGLALGAETPEEIAVSVLAEILAVQHGFEGGFLAGRETSLHRRADSSALARS